jgi:signal transduction histidine kinase
VVQEGMTNIARHARATSVSIDVRSKPGAVLCIIRDDGVGFDADAFDRRSGRELGLNGMRERLAILGGGLTIRSVSGAGTQLIASIPLDR